MTSRHSLSAAAVLFAIVGGHVRAQSDTPRGVSMSLDAKAVARVKDRYLAMDYAGGVEEADRLIAQFPRSRELAAWRVANLARVDRPREAEAAAKAILASNRNDPWGWFAQTFVGEYAAESGDAADVLKSSLEAYRRAPGNPTIVWLRAFALTNNREAAHAISLIDSAAARGPLSQEMRVLRATAMYNVATAGKLDQERSDSAFALYATARATDSTDATAYTFAASRMMGQGRNDEAYALAKRGAELSPLSLAAHENYWRAIDGMKARAQAERDAEVIADVEALVRTRGNEPTVLGSAARQLDSHRRPDRARELENRILAEHPATLNAEWVSVNRYRALDTQLRDSTLHDSSTAARYRQALWTFVDRPTHINSRLLGDAYRQLFFSTDSTTNADTLLRIVRGMVQYEGINPHIVFADGAIRLAERGRDFKEAEKIARAGLKAGKEKIDQQRSVYETVGDYARAADWMAAFMYDALGVVYMRQGRLDDAEKQLEHARELDPKSVKALFHLGRLAEMRGRLDAAEELYIKGSLLASIATNPNRESLRTLYRAKKGSLDGYDAYLSSLAETDRANRRTDVARSREARPRSLPTFAMRTVDGRLVSLDSLRGKTAVINNWGMWCGPCVAEMPELQKLAKQFEGDSMVRIVTIDNDPNTDSLRTWLQKKNYTFTTLIDDGYLSRSNVHTFPTTWFLDSSGRVIFTKTGWSEKLVEEFSWRIDMIRHPASNP